MCRAKEDKSPEAAKDVPEGKSEAKPRKSTRETNSDRLRKGREEDRNQGEETSTKSSCGREVKAKRSTTTPKPQLNPTVEERSKNQKSTIIPRTQDVLGVRTDFPQGTEGRVSAGGPENHE